MKKPSLIPTSLILKLVTHGERRTEKSGERFLFLLRWRRRRTAAKTRKFSPRLADFRRGSRRNFPALALGSDAALAENFSRKAEPEKTLSCFDLRAPTPRDNQRQHVKLCGQEQEHHRRKKRPQRPNLTQYDGTFSRPCQSAHDRANQLTETGENQLTEHGKTESEFSHALPVKNGYKSFIQVGESNTFIFARSVFNRLANVLPLSRKRTPDTQESETPREWYKLLDKLGVVITLTAVNAPQLHQHARAFASLCMSDHRHKTRRSRDVFLASFSLRSSYNLHFLTVRPPFNLTLATGRSCHQTRAPYNYQRGRDKTSHNRHGKA